MKRHCEFPFIELGMFSRVKKKKQRNVKTVQQRKVIKNAKARLNKIKHFTITCFKSFI